MIYFCFLILTTSPLSFLFVGADPNSFGSLRSYEIHNYDKLFAALDRGVLFSKLPDKVIMGPYKIQRHLYEGMRILAADFANINLLDLNQYDRENINVKYCLKEDKSLIFCYHIKNFGSGSITVLPTLKRLWKKHSASALKKIFTFGKQSKNIDDNKQSILMFIDLLTRTFYWDGEKIEKGLVQYFDIRKQFTQYKKIHDDPQYNVNLSTFIHQMYNYPHLHELYKVQENLLVKKKCNVSINSILPKLLCQTNIVQHFMCHTVPVMDPQKFYSKVLKDWSCIDIFGGIKNFFIYQTFKLFPSSIRDSLSSETSHVQLALAHFDPPNFYMHKTVTDLIICPILRYYVKIFELLEKLFVEGQIPDPTIIEDIMDFKIIEEVEKLSYPEIKVFIKAINEMKQCKDHK
ncbi:hypothetical protein SNEBB_006310 [Seison nebaliae]|nr:hypothetical protein SNEBB_006310 [Seison nebaliae]